jgi:hypothetical protein
MEGDLPFTHSLTNLEVQQTCHDVKKTMTPLCQTGLTNTTVYVKA